MMRGGLQKSKRISWAPDVTLCETKLFLKDDSPSQVGSGSQDDLQAKSSLFSHSSRSSLDDNLPPGFESAPSPNQNQSQFLEISQIKWKSPPKFEFNPDWQVVAGGESNEMEIENQRELRVLEAVYPRLSAIPPNPVFPMDPEGLYDDNKTPLIPMNPIEDEDVASDCISPTVPINSQPPNPNVEPDIARAAYAAVAAITKSNEHGNMIDNELLVKILSDPKLIEKLLVDHGTSQNVPLSNPAVPIQNPSSFTPSGQFYPSLQNGGPRPSSSVVPKDVNYYKNLIQQHGGERQQPMMTHQQQFGNRFNQDNNNNIIPPQFSNRFGPQLGESINSPRPRDPSKPKINKPCIYFNSSRGCRKGANCPYQHEASSQQQQQQQQQRGSNNSMPEGPAAKRMKMDREISS